MKNNQDWTPEDGDMLGALKTAMDPAPQTLEVAPERITRHGVTFELFPITSGTLEDAFDKYPDVDRGDFETDEEHKAAQETNSYQRGKLVLETMLHFGIVLDALPEDDRWLRRLQFMEKRGKIDLSEYDLENDIELEFLFKRYVLLTPLDLVRIGRKTGMDDATLDMIKKLA
jgi:hypothetical protein